MARRKVAEIKVQKREECGSSACKKLRRRGLIPGVVYGHGLNNVNVSVPAENFTDFLHSGSRVLRLKIGSDEDQVLVKDVQHDALTDEIIHVDFERISLDEKVTLEVPVELIGIAIGAKQGGVVDQPVKQLEIECAATNIPEFIEVDVSPLNIDDALTIADIKVGEGIILKAQPDQIVVKVLPPIKEVEEVPAEEAVVEPEVIAAKKEEEKAGLEEESEEKR